MGRPKKNLCGQVFHYLTVVGPASTRTEPSGRLATYWKCRCKCGTELEVKKDNLERGGTKSCGCWRVFQSRQRSGASSPAWRGGLLKSRPDGYVGVLRKEHSRASVAGYVLEHILVMEEKLARPLMRGETVHHKNGIRHDNRPENLELWCSNHPAGQRVEDLVRWATEIINRYAP